MSDELSPSRREYLVHSFAESMRVTLRILDWRSAAVGMLIAGLGTLALLLAPTPALVALAVVVHVLAVVLWAVRRSRVETAGYALLRQGLIPSGVPADHEATADLPIHLLEPEDAPDLDTLDRMLRARPEDMVALRAATRKARTSLMVLSLTGSASALLFVVAVAVIMTVGLTGENASGAFLYFALLFLVLAPGHLISSSATRYMVFVRSAVVAQLQRVEPLLQQLHSTSDPFLTGEAIKWAGDRYVIDCKKLPVSPAEPPFASAIRKASPWAMGACAAVVFLSAGFLSLYRFAGIL